jgi:hypothetical protein
VAGQSQSEPDSGPHLPSAHAVCRDLIGVGVAVLQKRRWRRLGAAGLGERGDAPAVRLHLDRGSRAVAMGEHIGGLVFRPAGVTASPPRPTQSPTVAPASATP